MDDPEPSPSGRSKRQRNDKNGRLSALEKLRQLKGSKHKYEVTELDNVYDEVDEKAYSKTVMERQNDDWIVDDGGSGYVEDGREIFDDDLDDDSIQEAARKSSLAGPRKRKKVEPKSKGNIKSMLMSMPAKKKTEDNLNDDDILGDLMNELQKDQPTPKRRNTGVRNKFATSKVQTPTRQESSASKRLDVDDFLEPMFESKRDKTPPPVAEKKAPGVERRDKKPPLVEEKQTNGKKTERDHFTFSEQSTSQRIDNDDTQSQMDGEDTVEIDSPVTQESPVDANQYDEDLGNFDFAEMEIDEKELPQCSTKSMEKAEKGDTKAVKKPESQVSNFKDVQSKNDDVEMMDQAWADAFSEQLTECEFSITSNVEIDSVPLVTNKAGDKVFRFYWWDAHEDYFKQPGVVYMFGKVYNEATGSYVSCCLQVKNIPRRIYLLPREFVQDSRKGAAEGDGPRETSISDVYEEFNKWATKNRVTEFRSAKVTKRYAFDRAGTPKECEYLEVRYSAGYPPMDPSYSGPTIEHVFGTSVNALELLLIERQIRGPCWLEVKAALPCGNPISWCKLQVNCAKFENITVCCGSDATEKSPIPPLVMATLNVRMSLNAKQHQNEVVMIGVLLHNEYQIDKPPPKPLFQQHYCLVTHPRDVPWPRHARDLLTKTHNTRVVRCDTEFDLLEEFLDIVHKCDPDLLIGYDCGFQLDVLMHRISTLKLKNWSRVGKLRRTVMPMFKGKINIGQCFSGRPICDIQVSAKELNLKLRSYDLQSLCCAVLKITENDCKEIKPADSPKFYAEAAKIEKLLQITMNEALYIVTVLFELNVMPLAVQITQIAGNVLSRTLSAGRAERNEYLLLHAFFKKDYITPDKRYANKSKNENEGQSRRKKPAYSGGLVLDPKKGFYDKLILLMDFNSLYPSIIQEYNMCFTTISGAAYADLDDLVIPESNLEPGVVPTEIRKLVESRGEVKKLMKTPNLSTELKLQYNIRQLALKLTANSMYGCLGATHCRFYAKGLAALVTSKGREILQNTKTLVEKLDFEVIYGDTDSIMINTKDLDYDKALANAKKIKQEVNKLYKRVELDIDGVFRYLLLLQKKKYAAVLMNKTPGGKIELVMEHKGLDIVRRDWCQLACDTGKTILDQLLSDQENDLRREKIFEILANVSTSLREARVPLSSLVVTKQLSKNPKDYPEKKLPHVSIALRLNMEGGRMWKAGDTVPYIICEDGTTRSATERAYHVDEFKKSDTLKIDVDYYLLSQVFPVVLRICEPIEGIDDVLLANHLGLEGVYKSKRVIHEQEDLEVPLQINEDRYKYCIPLKFKCRNAKCNREIEMKEFFTDFPSGRLPSLALCPNAECGTPPWKYAKAIKNELQLALRNFITEYYANWMECEDPICSNRTRHLPMNIRGNYPRCDICKDAYMHRIYSETMLYNQISFFLHLFDLSQAGKNLQGITSPDMISAYDSLKEFVERQLRRNAYSLVDLDSIFKAVQSTNSTLAIVDETEDSDFEFSDDESEMIPEVKEPAAS